MSTPTGSDENILYETIVEIPHYQCKSIVIHYLKFPAFLIIISSLEKKISYLLDKEDEEMVVEDSFDAFQKMY